MKKNIELEIKPLSKVPFLENQKLPKGVKKNDLTFASVKIDDKKPEMVLIGASCKELSDSCLTAVLFQGITEALYKANHQEDKKVVVNGKKVELTQSIK